MTNLNSILPKQGFLDIFFPNVISQPWRRLTDSDGSQCGWTDNGVGEEGEEKSPKDYVTTLVKILHVTRLFFDRCPPLFSLSPAQSSSYTAVGLQSLECFCLLTLTLITFPFLPSSFNWSLNRRHAPLCFICFDSFWTVLYGQACIKLTESGTCISCASISEKGGGKISLEEKKSLNLGSAAIPYASPVNQQYLSEVLEAASFWLWTVWRVLGKPWLKYIILFQRSFSPPEKLDVQLTRLAVPSFQRRRSST